MNNKDLPKEEKDKLVANAGKAVVEILTFHNITDHKVIDAVLDAYLQGCKDALTLVVKEVIKK